MIDQKYIVLIHRLLREELDEEERSVLQQWMEEGPENKKAYQEIEQTWRHSETYKTTYTPNVEAGLARLKQRIDADRMAVPKASLRPVRRPNRVYYYAAATVLLLIAAVSVWNFWIQPDGLRTVATGSGETMELQLADGSQVLLNENSTFTYSEAFNTQREVYLTGEAFFDVAQDSIRPFRIITPMAKTEVLGTSFNLRAYESETYTEVEVLEGKVQLQPKESKEKLSVSAGARGTYQHEAGQLGEVRPKTLNALYWKDGLLRFRNHTLAEALEEIRQRVGIQIIMQDKDLAPCPITIGIPLGAPDEIVDGITGILIDGHWEKAPSGEYLIMDGACPAVE